MGKAKNFFLICALAIISGGIIGTIIGTHKRISPNAYISTEQIEELNRISTQDTLWLNRKCFDHYQSSLYGNKNEILDSNGMVYKDNDIVVYSDDKGLHVNDEIVIDNCASFVNRYKDRIYYRDDTDRSIYYYDLKTKKIESVLSGNYTQLKIVDDKIYFIDFKNNKLYSYSLQTKECNKKLDLKIQKFTVIGDKYLVLTKKQKLKMIDGENTEFSIPGVNDYFYNGNLVTLSKNGIYNWKNMNSPNKIEIKKYNQIIGIVGDILYLDNYEKDSLKVLAVNLKTNNAVNRRILGKNYIIDSYIKYDDIEYLQYSKIDENQSKYYKINDFKN